MIAGYKPVLLALVVVSSLANGATAMGQEKRDLLKGITFEQSKTEVNKPDETRPIAEPGQSDSNAGIPFSCANIDNKSDKEKEVYAACLSALQENFVYESERLRHRKWVFRFQLIATNISFVIVMVMVGFGLWFAYVQFSRAFPKITPTTLKTTDLPTPPQIRDTSVTDIELSLARIKISSSILGVVILGLAMGFFYLYIRFVFPIQGIQ